MSLNSHRKLEFQQLYEQLYRKSLATNENKAIRCCVYIVVSGYYSDFLSFSGSDDDDEPEIDSTRYLCYNVLLVIRCFAH